MKWTDLINILFPFDLKFHRCQCLIFVLLKQLIKLMSKCLFLVFERIFPLQKEATQNTTIDLFFTVSVKSYHDNDKRGLPNPSVETD